MTFDPRPCSGRDPSDDFQNVLMVVYQMPCEDRLVMGDPVSQRSQMVQGTMGLPPRQGGAMGECST